MPLLSQTKLVKINVGTGYDTRRTVNMEQLKTNKE
jgi:hypothetical protein